jgi:hypothetical protein
MVKLAIRKAFLKLFRPAPRLSDAERTEALIAEYVRETMGFDDFDRDSPWTFIG